MYTHVTGECVWLDLKLISSCMSHCHSVFPVASYAYTTIPTYPCGQIGFFLASKDKVLSNIISFLTLDYRILYLRNQQGVSVMKK